jgi:hypothetical protein
MYAQDHLVHTDIGVNFHTEACALIPVSGYKSAIIQLKLPEEITLQAVKLPNNVCYVGAVIIGKACNALYDAIYQSSNMSNSLLQEARDRHQELLLLLDTFKLSNTPDKRALRDLSSALGYLFGTASESQVKA